ncbi:MAG: hypothetical protein C4334_08410 [Pyrinomonas sp.]
MVGGSSSFGEDWSIENARGNQEIAKWRRMTEDELRAVVPERAPVIKERIETELRTASGIVDGSGHHIFGVVIITAGYEAEGKYTHFFKTQVPIRVGDLDLSPGEYVFGYQRLAVDALRVVFYRATDGGQVGAVRATVENRRGAIYSFYIEPPTGGRGKIKIGRFGFDYSLAD